MVRTALTAAEPAPGAAGKPYATPACRMSKINEKCSGAMPSSRSCTGSGQSRRSGSHSMTGVCARDGKQDAGKHVPLLRFEQAGDEHTEPVMVGLHEPVAPSKSRPACSLHLGNLADSPVPRRQHPYHCGVRDHVFAAPGLHAG